MVQGQLNISSFHRVHYLLSEFRVFAKQALVVTYGSLHDLLIQGNSNISFIHLRNYGVPQSLQLCSAGTILPWM